MHLCPCMLYYSVDQHDNLNKILPYCFRAHNDLFNEMLIMYYETLKEGYSLTQVIN